MAAISYTTVQPSTYFGIGSQPDSYLSTTYGNYDSGLGSLTSHPYQYQTTSYGNSLTDSQPQFLHSNDYRQATYLNTGHSTQQQPQNIPTNKYTLQQQQPQNIPTNKYTQQQQQQQPQNIPSNKYTQQQQQQPQNIPTNKYAPPPQQQQQQLNNYSNPLTMKNSDRSQATNNNNNTKITATTKTVQLPQKKDMDNQYVESRNLQQNSHVGTTQHFPPAPADNQHHQSQTNLIRSERQITYPLPKQQHQQQKSQPTPPANLNRSDYQVSKSRTTSPPIRRRSFSINRNNQVSGTPPKTTNPSKELKLTKSSSMRAAAIKKQEGIREQKRKDQFFPSSQNKPSPTSQQKITPTSQQKITPASQQKITPASQQKITPASQQKVTPTKLKLQQTSQTEVVRNDTEKTKQNKKSSLSISKVLSKVRKTPHSAGEQTDAEKNNRNTKQLKSKSSSKIQKGSHSAVEHTYSEKTNRNKNKFQSQSLSRIQKGSYSDGEQTDAGKTNRNKKQSQSERRKSRRSAYQTEDNNSSGDDDNNNKHQRSKSKKRTTFSDSHIDKNAQLPPIRRSRLPPYDPYFDHPLPPGHPLRGRFLYDDYPPYGPYGRYSRRHLYEEAEDIPPYLASYHDAYDPFFDYEKRKAKLKHTDHEDNNGTMNGYETERDEDAKSQLSRKGKHKNDNNGRKSRPDYEENRRAYWPPGYYYPPYEDDALEIWRQERNDYLKKKFRPTVHDVLYSQQWMKSDSYLENQRRRALRDAQGYYFPYKRYTLKDYKDMQRLNNQNPFGDAHETLIDRKELAKKRQEYGSLVERQMADNPGTRHIPPREAPPRQPWHVTGGETHDPPNALSKRERALEYAKVQVKYRPVAPAKNRSHRSDPLDQNDDDHKSN